MLNQAALIAIFFALFTANIHGNESKMVVIPAGESNPGASKSSTIIEIDHKCHYPFNPSSMITILLFKKDGLEYISSFGEERCAWHFAKEIETTIRNSIIPKSFKQELSGEIKKAKQKRSAI